MSRITPLKNPSDRVLVIVGDASETVDTLYPCLRVQEEGFEPVVAAPDRRAYQMVLHEVPDNGWDITQETTGYKIHAEVAFRDVKPQDYIGIFFSGGRAPEYIRYDEDLIRITRYFFKHNLPVASVCHGAEIPAAAGVLDGRKIATVAKCRFDVEVCGGIYVEAPSVVDGNLVSGPTWHDHGHYIGPWIELLRQESARRRDSSITEPASLRS